MAEIIAGKKACTVNPLKMSAPIGAALAFLGMDRAVPLLHGSQGCTAFGLVLFVRHFRETIPLQTTAMSEVTTILGGQENIEQALLNIKKRANPALIGLCSTGITEAKGDDVGGFLKSIRDRHAELAGTEVVFAPTPDFIGGFSDGWAKAVTAMVDALVPRSKVRTPWQVNILAGCHLTPGDLEEIRETVEAFGLTAIILPDISGSLDGHIPETFLPHTLGGTRMEDVKRMGESALTIAIGEQMRPAAELLEKKTGVPVRVFERLNGLAACDAFMALLSDLSENEVPSKYKRQRSQLQDAMLDGHFYFGEQKVAIAAEPDLLYALSHFFADMGAQVTCAVAPQDAPVLTRVAADTVRIGDLQDFEDHAAGCNLLVTHSHGRQAAARLGIPLLRAGLPTFDRLGVAHKLTVGYRGTRDFIFEVGNVFMEQLHAHEQHITPASLRANATAASAPAVDAPACAGH
ncbi:nitrogenase iron-molybdenum cofactor biosynthesis protein NifN [Aromatoleum diolicum]|uniref:Nitrogenase iron-molybdenum cofactor biosynthesis protein NifN n=1 Tax=Aromatoleum diolicum TaxID=75796 RepID=A0ABX1Q4P9_9RHOO|nr:nitrogenase iron-molybdenum cofactor biosynthesis protein NifN [Aromatoleum diolicum]NMG73342.1 nitrogenase iron-molybdenum cofactor biosynthesis protein NifN [Aromatoleum diolicum]